MAVTEVYHHSAGQKWLLALIIAVILEMEPERNQFYTNRILHTIPAQRLLLRVIL